MLVVKSELGRPPHRCSSNDMHAYRECDEMTRWGAARVSDRLPENCAPGGLPVRHLFA